VFKNKMLLSLVILMVVALAGGGYLYLKSQPPKQLLTVKVGTMAIVDCLQIFVAEEKGFFKEEGLSVEATPMAGGAVIAPAVESGELDIGFSNLVSIIIAHEKGSDFKFLTPGAFKDEDKGNFVLVVAKNSNIANPKDLEGKTIAINTLQGILEMDMKAWAEKNSVEYSKLKVVAVPFPNMESALESKQVDVALIVEPYTTIGINNGSIRIFDARVLDAIASRLMISSWFAKESWLESNPNEAKAFRKAIIKANTYIQSHPQEMPEILSKYTRLQKEIASQTVINAYMNDILKKDIQVMIDASYKYGYIKQSFDARDIVAQDLPLK